MKNQREIKGPRKVNTYAMIGIKQKHKAPDSQTTQATCRAKEIDRASRSHSTREAKQNKTNKKNQGPPIKTIKSHDSIIVPLLGRAYLPPGLHRPCHSLHIPTNVWGAQDHESLVCSHVVGWPPLLPCARRSCFSRSLPHPFVPRRPIVNLRCKGPYGSVDSECQPAVHRRAVRGSERLEVVLKTIQPVLLRASLAWIFPPTSFPYISRFGRCPAGYLAMALANRSRRCRKVASTV